MLDRKSFEGRMDDCREMLKNPDEWKKLPLLNSTSSNLLRDGQLVRFVGMIQDMFNPVVFFSDYEVKNVKTGETEVRHGEYNDKVELEEDEVVLFDSQNTVPKDRKPYYCVSIPGLNDWVEKYHAIQQADVLEQLKECNLNCNIQSELNDKKRCSCDDKDEYQENNGGTNKRQCCGERNANEDRTKSEDSFNRSLYLPIENSRGMACLVNMYDDEQFSLNTVIEVAGFLSLDPTEMAESCDEDIPSIPPLSLVPHLHAVAVNKLKHSNPLLSPSYNTEEILRNAESIRAELNTVLRKIMFDDCLAADYLICYLLSSVYSRQNGVVLGKFSLNVSNIPTDCNYAKEFYAFLSNLVPKSHYFPLTIKNLNSMIFVPKKSYETNKLQSGMLQLSDNTFLILDESELKPGKLEDRGVKNVRALSRIITSQEIEYDFHYYPLEFSTDIPVLILSEGKSMLPCDFHVVLKNKENYSTEFVKELFSEATRFIKNSDLMDKFRIYLSTMASLTYEFSEVLQAKITEDFVNMRRNVATTTSQDLHDLLALARLFSISRGNTSLTSQTWEIVREMEQQRKHQ